VEWNITSRCKIHANLASWALSGAERLVLNGKRSRKRNMKRAKETNERAAEVVV
jgi:hypothetical protein